MILQLGKKFNKESKQNILFSLLLLLRLQVPLKHKGKYDWLKKIRVNYNFWYGRPLYKKITLETEGKDLREEWLSQLCTQLNQLELHVAADNSGLNGIWTIDPFVILVQCSTKLSLSTQLGSGVVSSWYTQSTIHIEECKWVISIWKNMYLNCRERCEDKNSVSNTERLFRKISK